MHRNRTATIINIESIEAESCPPGIASENPGLLSIPAVIKNKTDKIQ